MKRSTAIILALLLIVVGAAGFFGYKYQINRTKQRSAIFMTNGQVYFGYLSGSNLNTVTLSDVYYLKVSDLQNSTNQKILLVKMGNELHGPENTMYIDRNQILFWQTLRSDSKINAAIVKFNSTSGS